MKLYIPTCVYKEKNCVLNHKKELASYGRKAMIVTGKHSSKINGSLDAVILALTEEDREYVIWDEIEENPSVETVMRARDRGIGEKADFCIGVGGGSPMDAAKAIALMMANPDRDGTVLWEKETLSSLPVVCVPTTAGTGSEVTPYSILTIHEKRTKKSISHRIFPSLALWDIEYLKTDSREGLINTAVDTLAHLVESYLNTNSDSYNRIYSERGLFLWGTIKEELKEGKITEHTFDTMSEACICGGMAISHTGTSLPHGLSYMITYELGVPHGRAVGIYLAGYVEGCLKHHREEAEKVLSLLGFSDCEAFGAYLKKLLGRVEIEENMHRENAKTVAENPGKLANCPYRVSEEELAVMAK